MRVCTRCVMDTTDPNIVFDKDGVCNHCKDYFELEKGMVIRDEEGLKRLDAIVNTIKKQGRRKKYDCLFGISGGADSSYVAYLIKKYGLRTLLLHIDNGWNTEAANQSIERIVDYTGFDIERVYVDWETFKDLQLAYLKASVIDIEAVTDHVLRPILYKTASENNIKNIVDGHNIATEGILPRAWTWIKQDLKNLKAIHKQFGTTSIEKFPSMGILEMLFKEYFGGYKFYYPLNYVDYHRDEAKEILRKEFDWVDYGDKHCESIFTMFSQRYILPTKFGVDKRKAHFSALICSGEITREEALERLKEPLFTEEKLIEIKTHVVNKLELSMTEFDAIMNLEIRKHSDYPSNAWIYYSLGKIRRVLWGVFK